MVKRITIGGISTNTKQTEEKRKELNISACSFMFVIAFAKKERRLNNTA